MTRQQQIERVIGKLRTAWLQAPTDRLGQLILSLPPEERGDFFLETWYRPDDAWERDLDARIATHQPIAPVKASTLRALVRRIASWIRGGTP